MLLSKFTSKSENRAMDYFFKDSGTDTASSKLGKELLSALLKSAGRGKDEIVQIIGREMGFALAAVLKEPLERLVQNKKVQVTFELVDKEKKETAKTRSKKTKKTVSKKK